MVLIESPVLTGIERILEAVRCVGLVESVAVTLTLDVPVAVGVPLIVPELESMDNPAGNPVADQVKGGVPPVAATVVE